MTEKLLTGTLASTQTKQPTVGNIGINGTNGITNCSIGGTLEPNILHAIGTSGKTKNACNKNADKTSWMCRLLSLYA